MICRKNYNFDLNSRHRRDPTNRSILIASASTLQIMTKLRALNRELVSNLRKHEILTDVKRNLILSILKSTTTKREAKNYLAKYRNQFEFSNRVFPKANATAIIDQPHPLAEQENQRELFINRFLNQQNPFLNIYVDMTQKFEKIPLRLAIIKIKFTKISQHEWAGISETFRRIMNLGIAPIIILDYDHLPKDTFRNTELYMASQATRLANYLGRPETESAGGLQTTVLRSLFSIPAAEDPSQTPEPVLDSLERILVPLYQGIIPIIQPFAYNVENGSQDFISSNLLLFSLCSGLVRDRTRELLSIEKIVYVDPLGGIPSIERKQTSHVFINLSQEYSSIVAELYVGFVKPEQRALHLQNLSSVSKILEMIKTRTGSDDTTAIITTPYVMSINDDHLNPVVYNILTDRPIISSSLPSSHNRTPLISTSIIKKGISVSVIDQASYPHTFTMDNIFSDKFVDKDKLSLLISDSFGRELDVDAYFARINKLVATIIIVGDYEGAAIITAEANPLPRSFQHDKIAYLDKFAIAKKNQGLPGLADIIFKAIALSHPTELIWRSRKNNPVNKWYFDRSIGSVSAPDSNWRIFYTGSVFDKKLDKTRKRPDAGTVDIGYKLQCYTRICEGIPASFKE